MINASSGLNHNVTIGNSKSQPAKGKADKDTRDVNAEGEVKKQDKPKKSATKPAPAQANNHQEQLRQVSIRLAQAAEQNTMGKASGLASKSAYSMQRK